MKFRMYGAALAMAAVLSGIPRAPASAPATPMDWSSVIKQAMPAVVDISIETLVNRNGVQQRQSEVGTGFLIDSDGTIVTNRHVIDGAFRIIVTMSDGSQYQAKLIGAGAMVDVAVLKIKALHSLPFLKFADSGKAEIGDPIAVVGNPLGLGTSLSTGVVSAVHRNLMNTPVDDYIQTDAALNHGNSGGPMLDRNGDVIGVSTILVTNGDGQGSQGLGFAIASDEVSLTVRRLEDPQSVPLGWIGVQLQDVTPALKSALGLQQLGGYLVSSVQPGGPADQAGLQSGDVITRVGDDGPAHSPELITDILKMPLGTRLPVAFEREGKAMQAEVTVAPWDQVIRGEEALMHPMAEAQAAQSPELGLLLAPISGLARRLYHITTDQGVAVAAVDPASDAFVEGIAPGDVIEKVQDQVVTSPEQAMDVAKQAMVQNRFIVLLVEKKGSDPRWVPVYSGHMPRPEAGVQMSQARTPTNQAEAGAVGLQKP